MRRYIDRDELISNLVELPEQERIIYMGIYDCLRSQPTADVAEVVRCKDCKHFDKNKKFRSIKLSFSFCDKFHHNIITENDYCSYGERMDGMDGETNDT